MGTRHRLAITAVAGLLLVAAACGDDEGSGGGDAAQLDGRTFLSQEVTEAGAGRALVDGTVIRLEFVDDEVRAHAGCNHLFGTIESTAGGTLSVGQMGGTEMGCDTARHDQDRWLMALLVSEPGWDLDGDVLVLTSGPTTVTFLDRRVADPDRALEGTRWVVDTIIQGDAAMSVPGDRPAELILEGGRVDGFTGCNELSGSYRIDDGSIHFESFVQTDASCDPEIMVLEDAVVALGGTTAEYDVMATRLTLVGPDGRGLALHASDG
jgi:heat shock protein HslJ